MLNDRQRLVTMCSGEIITYLVNQHVYAELLSYETSYIVKIKTLHEHNYDN